ncbi:MAG: FtsK/SpoIIIE domain-containing protein [Magnetococcus sp. WYHC-3]
MGGTRPAPAPLQRLSPLHAGDRAFTLPPLSLLADPPAVRDAVSPQELHDMARLLEAKLGDFKVKGQIIDAVPGPVVVTFEMDPAPGLRSAKVITLADDLARSVGVASVRVVGNIPGKNVIGIEVPATNRQVVYLSEILRSDTFQAMKSPLTLALGFDITGAPVVANLAKMPHLLVAGTTGSGKSVAVNAMICSILFNATPEQVRFLMVDPKMLELSIYEGIPHLLAPVVTDVRKASMLLKWAVGEMEERYRLMSELGVRNIDGFNQRIEQCLQNGEQPTRRVKVGFDPETGQPVEQDEPIKLKKKPFIVIIIDELADLMLQVGKEVEPAIARLAQMARAAGLHLIIATQRPSVDVITGLIKANFPTRLAFQVSSRIDSRTILDSMGAERLLGMGDGLYQPPGTGGLKRIHAPFVADAEVHALVKQLKSQGAPEYETGIFVDSGEGGDDGDAEFDFAAGAILGDSASEGDYDEFYDQSVALVLRTRRVSTSMIQRQFAIGYNRAARIVDRMALDGLITEPNHQGKREVLAPNAGGTGD